jgi:subtilisin family serine protease
MQKLIYFILITFSFNILASTMIKVAVIDTGIDPSYLKFIPLCQSGHKDFSGEGLYDYHGHGTNVTGLIVNSAQNSNYCIVLIKAYATQWHKRQYITAALEYAQSIGVNIINLSSGGSGSDEKERKIVNILLKEKVTLVFASGNNSDNLDQNCQYFPACYDNRIYVIGSSHFSSNYGKIVDMTFNGQNRTAFGKTLSGSSQAAALFTGELLKQIALRQKGR